MGALLVLALNVALGLTPQVPTYVVVTAWAVTVFLALLWWIARNADRPTPTESFGLGVQSTEPRSSTLAQMIAWIQRQRDEK